MFNKANTKKKLLTLLGLGVGLMALAACATQPASTTNNAEAAGNQVNPPAASGNSSNVQPVAGSETYLNSGSGRVALAEHGVNTGISVSGQGKVSGSADLAVLNLGVEAFRDTVQAAREDAAAAMQQVVQVLKDNGIEDRDIQTSRFSIHPRYDRDGRSISGFEVSNQLTVKVRDLNAVGEIIDEVTVAGGDLTRFQGVSFQIEDTTGLEEQARAKAVANAVGKANQLATLSGVELGRPFFISETNVFTPMRGFAFAEAASFDQAAGTPTSIQPGEVEVVINVQAIFEIQ